ncbi:MAG: hypothetical protein ABI896_01310 [Actinomycetota bacterium]
MIQLSAADHAELVSRLTALRGLAEGLSMAFDDPKAGQGARDVLASIDRMLAILRAPVPET